jgi:hypothetical protein
MKNSGESKTTKRMVLVIADWVSILLLLYPVLSVPILSRRMTAKAVDQLNDQNTMKIRCTPFKKRKNEG